MKWSIVSRTPFIRPSDLKENDLSKPAILQTVDNLLNNCVNKLKHFLNHSSSLNIYEDLKYNQPQYYHNEPKNHKHIPTIQSYIITLLT